MMHFTEVQVADLLPETRLYLISHKENIGYEG